VITPTAGELIGAIADTFANSDLTYGHGTDNPDDEAAWLVFHVMGLSFSQTADVYDTPATAAHLDQVKSLAERRVRERRPLAYLLNEAWFAGLSFYVDERVLVPRSPIAEPLLAGFSPWLDPSGVRRVLDVGTGSGCIAIAAATVFPDATVDAVDVSPDALEVARINVERHALDGRVFLHESDLFDNLADKKYQLIVSNPPYVDADDMAARADEFRHEPELGLASGQDGLDATRRILATASRFLDTDGILVCEVGNSMAALEASFPEVPFVWLDFEHGGDGVFLLTRDELEKLDVRK